MNGNSRIFFLYVFPALVVVAALSVLPAIMTPYLGFFGTWTPYAASTIVVIFVLWAYRKWILKRQALGAT